MVLYGRSFPESEPGSDQGDDPEGGTVKGRSGD